MSIYLFSYDTLQDKNIQNELFHRLLIGNPDLLLGFELPRKKAYGEYSVISRATNPSSSVKGMVYQISAGEIEKVDAYEGEEYVRILVKLQSGKKAWVYIAKEP